MKSTLHFVNCLTPSKLKGIRVVVLKVSKGGENFVMKKKIHLSRLALLSERR